MVDWSVFFFFKCITRFQMKVGRFDQMDYFSHKFEDFISTLFLYLECCVRHANVSSASCQFSSFLFGMWEKNKTSRRRTLSMTDHFHVEFNSEPFYSHKFCPLTYYQSHRTQMKSYKTFNIVNRSNLRKRR